MPAIRLRDIVSAEVSKILTHPTTLVALALAAAANTLFAAVAASEVVRFGAGDDLAPLSAFALVMFAPVYAFLLIPVSATGSEYHGGQFRITLAAVPDRGRLACGKFLAMTAVVIPVAAAVLAPGRVVIGLSDGLSTGAVALDLGRWVLAYTAMSVIAFGLAAVLRSTVAPLAVFVVVAVFAGGGFVQWPEGVRFLPDQASMSLLGTPAFEVTEIAPATAALTLAVWALASLAAYALSLMRRDA
nr:ABC transporter [Nocardiopsis mwathae]